MGETRVDLLHLLEDLRDAYPGAIEDTILIEIVANSLDSGASTIRIATDPAQGTLTVVDDGSGMRRAELGRYHDIAATTKTRGEGIGFAGVGIKLGLLVCQEVFTETRRGKQHVATSWRLASRKRAPWKWVTPLGLVAQPGTAVRLKVRDAFSPLVDPGYIANLLYQHYQPLLEPYFDAFLAPHYPNGVRFVLNGRVLVRRAGRAKETAAIAVRLPRKRKPSAVGYLVREAAALPEDGRGLAISTFGKIIKQGWDWLGVSPAVPELVSGLIEAPSLAECLTLNKADFIRAGQRGAIYLAYRQAIQEAVSRQLAEWGELRDRQEQARRRAARPVERDLQSVLVDLAEEFPLLSTLVERHAGGQRRLPMGSASQQAEELLVAGAETKADAAPEEPEPARSDQTATPTEPEAPPPTVDARRAKGPRRPARYGLRIRFERRPEDMQLARLVEYTVWVNEAHPAYQRADASHAVGYHVALSTAMALSMLAVEPKRQHEFVTCFLTLWGKAVEKGKRRRRKKRT